MVKKIAPQEAQTPLILRCHRLMDAFAKSNDERDFYLNRKEGFIVYVDLDKSEEELAALEAELQKSAEDYCLVIKLTFYETKKIMEGFITEKVYDIDTKEKLLDIIQSKEARENFLEFISDHHAEFEKWQQYYQERSRIRIIEWLRVNHFHFVFEEDLEIDSDEINLLRQTLFEVKANKEVTALRKVLSTKAKTYYSTEALNPRPKRGRPPKQAVKVEVEANTSIDVFLTAPSAVRPFLFIPETSTSGMAFSSKFEGELNLITPRRLAVEDLDATSVSLEKKMSLLRNLSSKWVDDEEDDEDEEETGKKSLKRPKSKTSAGTKASTLSKAAPATSKTKKIAAKSSVKNTKSALTTKSKPTTKSAAVSKVQPKSKTATKTAASKAKAKAKPKVATKKSSAPSKPSDKAPTKTGRRPVLRSIVKSKKKK